MRSSQLDAERLDDELTSMLREQLLRCATWVLKPGLLARLQPELTLLLDLLVSCRALQWVMQKKQLATGCSRLMDLADFVAIGRVAVPALCSRFLHV